MKKIFIVATLSTLIFADLARAAEIMEIPFAPVSPVIISHGGSFIANAHGYDSFFYNPAGFSREGGTFTVDIGAWMYTRPDVLMDAAGKMLNDSFDTTAQLNFMSGQVTSGGLGVGSSIGVGMTRDGLGLGMIIIMDSMVYGPSLLGMTGDLTGTIGFIGGLSTPFNLYGIKVHVGGQIRPMIRIHAPLANADALGIVTALATGGDAAAALNAAGAVYGSGIGLDIGAIAELAGFSLGISLRDIAGTRFKYSRDTFGTVWGAFSSQMKFPTGTTVTADTYLIPMNLSAGIAYHPDLGNKLKYVFDPLFSVDVQDVVGILQNNRSPWTLLHAGVEMLVLNMFSLGAGLNQGYITLGGGIKVFAFNLNFSVFTRELGTYLGDRASSGATLNISFRF